MTNPQQINGQADDAAAMRADAASAYSLSRAMLDGAQANAATEYALHFGEPGFTNPNGMYIDQHYEGYSGADQQVWRELYRRQHDHLEAHASEVWLRGARAIGLGPDAIPDLRIINTNLRRLTGWQSRAVPGYISARPFFACLAQREFPTTVFIRTKERIDYLPEPDIFTMCLAMCPCTRILRLPISCRNTAKRRSLPMRNIRSDSRDSSGTPLSSD